MEKEIALYLEYISKSLNVAPKTYKYHKSKIYNFQRYLKLKLNISSVYEIKILHVIEYLNSIKDIKIDNHSRYYESGGDVTLSAGAVQIYVNVLKGFFKYLSIYGDNSCVDWKLIPNQKVKKPKINVLDDISIEALKACPEAIEKRRDIALRNKLYITMLYITGCRASELLNLKITDIKHSSDDVQIRGKGERNRVVIINNEVRKILDQYIEERKKPVETGLGVYFNPPESEYIFIALDSNNRGRKIKYDAMLRYFQKYDQIIKVRPHTLRHSFATKCLRSGVRERYIQVMLGHAHITTTQRYCQVYDSDILLQHKSVFGQ